MVRGNILPNPLLKILRDCVPGASLPVARLGWRIIYDALVEQTKQVQNIYIRGVLRYAPKVPIILISGVRKCEYRY